MAEHVDNRSVRVRFAPSPSGDLHVGNIRTALYNWAFARHNNGSFIFRVEDTDRARVTDEHIRAAADTLRWLDLDWDEGPEVGGPHQPYLQSKRMEIYADWAQRFLVAGLAYEDFTTPEELDALRAEQRRQGKPEGYDNRGRYLTEEQRTAYRAEGRQPALRYRMPDGQTVVHDMIRGEIVFDNSTIPDFVIVRADGTPLYTLAVAVDDVLMGITHVLRGEDLLSSTPRQLAVYRGMGLSEDELPKFGHLPFVMGSDNLKLSKRNGEVSIAWYRHHGFLPEAMTNYLALLGWSLGEDREDFSLEEMAKTFTIERVNKNPARFDLKKLTAINGAKIRALEPADFANRVLPFLQGAGLVSHEPTEVELQLLTAAAPLIQERIEHLTDAIDMLGFLFVAEDHFSVDDEAAARLLTEESRPILGAAETALAKLDGWDAASIEAALRLALVDDLGLKPKLAFGPVRVAVTGRRISPPLFESLELLGRDRTLARLRAAPEMHVGV